MHLHQHNEGAGQGVPTEYIHKLWMGHGITAGGDLGNFNTRWLIHHKQRAWNNEITSPRIQAFVVFGRDGEEPVTNPDAARRWVQWVKEQGADGIKFFGAQPRIFRAALDEAAIQGLRSTSHHAQLDVVGMNALETARAGLTSMTHWYGLPEAMFVDKVIQHYPVDYNYNNEYHRFGEAGRLWAQAAPPFSEKWNAVMNELLELDFSIHPTWVAYIGTRDLMRPAAERVALGLHPPEPLGVLPAERGEPRLLLLRLDHPGRTELEGELPPLDDLRERVQEPRRPRRGR